MAQQKAVVVRNAMKRYGKGQYVLDGLNIAVSRGSIYGLLGASGCGKTTLLSCVVGVRYLDSGEVWVLGGNPGSKGSGIPGPRVGYMPQEMSLVEALSVSDTFYYFGRINGLDDEEIETKEKFFSELLQLPPSNHLVKNLSGGQQRRVSFAAALLHRPELLILDEPTVGLDPVLRENIWAYLIKVTREENVTVLITTHYIEETKDANKIGLMRCGKMLAESTPQNLLERLQCSFLEEAFLKLCMAENNADILNEAHECDAEDTHSDLDRGQDKHEQGKENAEYKTVSKRQVLRSRRFKALLAKNGIQFLRNYVGIFFALFYPIIQTGAFLIGVGNDPKDLKIGVVNDEAGNCDYGSNFGNIWNDEITCHFGNLSCRFLYKFSGFIATQKYDNILEASHDVQHGEVRGIIHFNQNFSEALQIRVEDANFAKDSDLFASQIHVFLDMGDRQIGLFMQTKLFDHFLEVYEDIMRECKYSPKLTDLPIRFEDPIYGTTGFIFTYHLIPTYILVTMFFLASTVSTSLIITDRLEGIWDRSVVQGVRMQEILLSHVLIQSSAIVMQITIIMLIFFPIWGLECKGSLFAAVVLVFLSGSCGLMYGFAISVMYRNRTMAYYTSAGSFIPLVLLSGFMWPLEGMPIVLRWVSYTLPVTFPSISLRGVIYKGYSLSDSEVYVGFLISLGWLLLYFIVTLFGLRSKSS